MKSVVSSIIIFDLFFLINRIALYFAVICISLFLIFTMRLGT
jgi:hypothetical protein